MSAVPKHIFSRPRCNLAPPAEFNTELVALKRAFQELEHNYNCYNSALRTTHFVCNFSSNNLTLDHISHFAEWLEGSSLRIYALDLTFNRIFSASWKPVLDVVERLFKHVDYLQLGGSYLPALTAELTKLQASGYVSLALPITGSPVNQWQKKWDDIATEFGSKAYDPDTLQYGELCYYIVILTVACKKQTETVTLQVESSIFMVKTPLGGSGHSSVQICKHKAAQNCNQDFGSTSW
ncbi:TPA: hypothetical protein ACH3X2_005126 [Trebouxia sp. C0005]